MLYKCYDGVMYSRFEYDKFFEKYDGCLLVMNAHDTLEMYEEIKPYLIGKSACANKYEKLLKWLKAQMWHIQVDNLEHEDIWVVVSVLDGAIQWMFYEKKSYIDKVLDTELPKNYYSKEIPAVYDYENTKNESDDEVSANKAVVYRMYNDYRSRGLEHSDVEKKYALTGMAVFYNYYMQNDEVRIAGLKGFSYAYEAEGNEE